MLPRIELIAVLGIGALLFGLPSPGESITLVEAVRDAILTSLTAVVAVSVFQVVTLMRRQQVIIREDQRQATLREKWIQSMLENTADALVTIDAGGTIRSINRAAREMFGYRDDELIGRPISPFIAGAGQADFGAYLATRMRHGDRGWDPAREKRAGPAATSEPSRWSTALVRRSMVGHGSSS